MKPTISIVGALLLTLLASSASSGSRAAPPAAQGAPPQADVSGRFLDASEASVLRAECFADLVLEDIASMRNTDPASFEHSMLSRFLPAHALAAQGKRDEVKHELERLRDDADARARLIAWKGLRQLAVQPDRAIAHKVQGVVIELHNQAGFGMIAAYEDGPARWISGQGAATIWEAPREIAEIDALIRALLRDSAPLAEAGAPSESRDRSVLPLDHVRATVLTYGGLHIAEANSASLHPGEPLTAPFSDSVKLVERIIRDQKP